MHPTRANRSRDLRHRRLRAASRDVVERPGAASVDSRTGIGCGRGIGPTANLLLCFRYQKQQTYRTMVRFSQMVRSSQKASDYETGVSALPLSADQ